MMGSSEKDDRDIDDTVTAIEKKGRGKRG